MSTKTKVNKYGLTGKRFVITGTLAAWTRAEAEKEIETRGGIVQTSVNTNTDYLVAGMAPGSKLVKAKKHGVTVLNEIEFGFLLKGKPIPDNNKWIYIVPTEKNASSNQASKEKDYQISTGRKFKFDEYST